MEVEILFNKHTNITIEYFLENIVHNNVEMNLDLTFMNKLLKELGCPVNNDNLDLKSFSKLYYIYSKATLKEKYLLIFNIFDTSNKKFLSKSDFNNMLIYILQSREQKFDFNENSQVNKKINDPTNLLSKFINDLAFKLYDTNNNGKLSFEEFLKFARDDDNIQLLIQSLSIQEDILTL